MAGAQGGSRTHTPLRGADFKSPKAHSPSGNVHLVNSFVSDRQLRGLSPKTCQFYEGYLTRFVNTIYKPLLDISKNDIATVLGSLACNAGGKHAYFRVLRAFYRWACQEGLLVNNPMVNMKAPKKPLEPPQQDWLSIIYPHQLFSWICSSCILSLFERWAAEFLGGGDSTR